VSYALRAACAPPAKNPSPAARIFGVSRKRELSAKLTEGLTTPPPLRGTSPYTGEAREKVAVLRKAAAHRAFGGGRSPHPSAARTPRPPLRSVALRTTGLPGGNTAPFLHPIFYTHTLETARFISSFPYFSCSFSRRQQGSCQNIDTSPKICAIKTTSELVVFPDPRRVSTC